MSTAFYMTLSEYGYDPILCTEVIRAKKSELFDHSWVEFDGKIGHVFNIEIIIIGSVRVQ
ncbi:TPA: hypothetical protein U2M59_002992 [Providencia stuartii]|nr:hypothetical protein [Providencia stuartii]